MSSDSKSLFGGQPRLVESTGFNQTIDPITGNTSPPHQPNSPGHSSMTRYEFSSPSSLASTASAKSPEHASRSTTWPQGVQTPPADSISRIKQQFQRILSDQVTPLRLAGHLSVLLVAAVILILSQADIPELDIALGTIPGNSSSAGPATQTSASSLLGTGQANDESTTTESLQRAAVPFTIIPERGREELQAYAVQSGDTVLGIAEQFGLNPETIQWSNPELEANPDLLRIGDKLQIMPLNGAIHTVSPGDTLSSLAAKYKVSIEDIIGYTANDISDATMPLVVGTDIVVPGGTKPYVSRQVAAYSGPIPTSAYKGLGSFSWPVSGSISQRYWSGHPAIDIGSWNGSPIKASDSGYVVAAGGGWNGGYGNYVLIDHGNGFTTLYAHLSGIFVRTGENVSRGEQIGSAGNTGNSTGPHLHFEVRYQGVSQNPFTYLP
jgi:murein DD-endopeptidase MepM/ murein hydrolase activator NlpD